MKYSNIIIRTMLGGMSNNVSKLAINSIPLYYFLIFRYIGMLVLNGFFSKKNLSKDLFKITHNKKLRYSLLLSALLSALGSTFFYLGLQELPVSVVSLLDNSFNILFTFIIGSLLFKESHSKKFYFLLGLMFPSLYLILFKEIGSSLTLSLTGILFLAMNGLVCGLETHLTKKQVKEISVGVNVLIKTSVSLIIAIICAFIFDNKWEDVVNGFTYIVALLLTYNIVNSYIIKILHTKSIKDIGAVQTTLFTALTPLFSIVFAMFIFGEMLSLTQWIGVISIIIILYFIRD